MSAKNKKGQTVSAKKDLTKLKTPYTYAIIFFVVLFCWILTFLIPAGKFSTHTIEYTDANGETASRTVLMADTFRYSYRLNTDFVADALVEISQDPALMDEWEVDQEALALTLESTTEASFDGTSAALNNTANLYLTGEKEPILTQTRTVASVDAPASLAEGEVVTPGTMDDTAFQTFLNQELTTITSSGTKMLQLLPESVLQLLLPALSMM